MAFVYHHNEPTNIVVSLGNYEGRPRQFWVRGNAPDPAKVSVQDGLVKYELVWGRLGTAGQRQERLDADVTQGVVLAQLQADGRLKLEVFPRRNAPEVTGFTAAARLLER